MSDLDAAAFSDFYAAIHGYAPFPWQQDLADRLLQGHPWPDAVDVPTGLGKTSLIDIAVFAAAAGAPAARRRVFFVVDRRLVVDEAFDHATALSEALNAPQSYGPTVCRVAQALRQPTAPDPVIETTRMRGGTTWSWRWVERPDRHAVVVGTVDQIGSRLLMRGYGVGANLAPIDAALVGTDSLILVDEAHLAPTMLRTITAATSPDGDRLSTPLVVPLSATVPTYPDATIHTTTQADLDHPVARARLRAPRHLHLIVPKTRPNTSSATMVTQLAGWSHALAHGQESGRVVLTVCNTVARARAVFDALAQRGVTEDNRVLLTGRTRPLDRDHTIAASYHRFRLGSRSYAPGVPFHVVATQTVEVGANIDADALVTESASLTALTQRLGRLGRAPDQRPRPSTLFPAVVIHDATTGDDDPIYGPARAATWKMLTEHAPQPALVPTAKTPFDPANLPQGMPVSPVALARLRDRLSAEQRHKLAGPQARPAILTKPTVDAWTRTAPRPHPDPPVAPYLHGLDTGEADIQLLWRADLTDTDLETGKELLRFVPPVDEEMLPLPLPALRRWASGSQTQASEVADVEGDTHTDTPQTDQAPTVLRYRGRDDIEAIPLTQVQPGDTIAVPAHWGGCDAYGWAPTSTTPVTDLADLASRRQRPLVRLHPRLLTLLDHHLDIEQPPEAAQTLPRLRGHLNELLTLLPEPDEQEQPPPQPSDYTEALTPFTTLDSHLPAATRPGRLLANLAHLAHADRITTTALPTSDTQPPTVLLALRSGGQASDEDTTSSSTAPTPLTLETHQDDVARQAADFARNLGLEPPLVHAVWLAARYHDEGKRDPRFQAMLHGLPPAALAQAPVLAKSGLNPTDRRAHEQALRQSGYPPGMRHEALSTRIAACYLTQANYAVDTDLVLHLIAAHHGHARPLIPAVADPAPVTITLPEGTTLDSTTGPDWQAPTRFTHLNHTYGPWKLALLETIVRLADIWCSAGHPVTTAAHPHIPHTHTTPTPPTSPPSHTVELPALDGRDPLGFLTSLGLLRLLTTESTLDARLSFNPATATAQLTSPLPDTEAIATELTTLLASIGDDQLLIAMPSAWPPHAPRGKDPLRVTPEEFPDLINRTHNLSERATHEWLAAIATDLTTDTTGRCALTPFMAPAGKQQVATFFAKPLHALRDDPARLHQALTTWRRLDNFTGEYFDHRAIRTAGDLPTGESTPAGVPGPTWLATQALPLTRLTSHGSSPLATLWHRLGGRRIMVWPVWRSPLDLAAVQVLVEHPALRPTPHDAVARPEPSVPRDRIAPLGVITMAAAERRSVPGSKSAGPLTPIPLHIT
ncbi:type I-G CRISPR-associated helicase/endonuclease Cas3g [Salinactinospora qingdaonensis]|uniref:HD Cas3-type domain-containing protein n=1 Tax=Salinactinospora qingdaonensis TaxID=702744 RepID=A0ABP7F968_9ACTN